MMIILPAAQQHLSGRRWDETPTPKPDCNCTEEKEDESTDVQSTVPPSRIHGFCTNVFAEDEPGNVYSKEEVLDSHAALRKAFLRNAGTCKESLEWADVISPSPITVSLENVQVFAKLQRALSAGLAGVLRSWGNQDSWLRKALPLPPRATSLLARCTEFTTGLQNVHLPIGSFRPDVLIDEDGRFRLCEINARFTTNGYFMTSELAEGLHSLPTSTALGSLPLSVVPATQSLVADLSDRFDSNETLFVLVGREGIHDLAVLDNLFAKLRKRDFRAPSIKFVHPKQLRAGDEPNSLVCTVDGYKTPVPVNQCILELQQDELLALSDSVIDGLLALSVESRCLNPIWTILLLHDKRMLGILRSLTPEELPDEEARLLLNDIIIPTVHLNSIEDLERIVSKERGLTETTFVAKPCLHGKGQGILLEKDFATPELFVKAVSEKAEEMLDGAEDGEVYPYTVQTYVKQERFNMLAAPKDDPSLTPKAWNVVASFMCLDDHFLGPAIFRSCADDLVAISSGGMMLLPALDLPIALPNLRFVGNTIDNVQADKVRSALINEGLALVSLDQAVSDPQEFAKFIGDDLGAELHQHSSDVGGVWSIKSKKTNAIARSHTTDPFLPHTDASFEPMPPRFFALSVIRSDHGIGGLTCFASVEEAVKMLSAEEYDTLLNTSVHWKRPIEFTKHGMETTVAPVLFSKYRARIRGDIIMTDHLSDEDEKRFWDAYNRFYGHLEELCHKSARILPERTIILMDNQKFVHARTSIIDDRRSLLRIRFDIPDLPEKLWM